MNDEKQLLIKIDCNLTNLSQNFCEFKEDQKSAIMRIHGRLDSKVPKWVLLLLVTVFLTGFGAFAKVLGEVQGSIDNINRNYVNKEELKQISKEIKK